MAYAPDAWVRKLNQVVPDGVVCISFFLQDGFNIVPGQLGPVLSIIKVVIGIGLRKHRIAKAVCSPKWSRGQGPSYDRKTKVNAGLGSFKIIQVNQSFAAFADLRGMAGIHLGSFC